MDVEIENNLDVTTSSDIELVTSGNLEITNDISTDLEINATKREFTIVDDAVFPKGYTDAPQWLKDLVDEVVAVGVSTNNDNLLANVQDLVNNLASSTVPLNTFTQSILQLAQDNLKINSVIDTLNSNFVTATGETNAQLTEIRNTYVTKESAEVTVANVLSAEIRDPNSELGTISATLGTVQQALVDETSARALDYTVLESTIAGDTEATATAIETINTYVGIDEAGASTNIGLSAYLEDSLGNIGGADSNVANAVYIENGVPKSKWEYDSILNISGVNYNSGFGLKTSGTGAPEDPYTSEFWVNAEKFKFTNSNQTGQTNPFTIDASGVTPQITFNGVVSFSNVAGKPTSTSGAGNPVATTEPILSVYKNTTDGSLWTYTSSGWTPGGNPNALTAEDLSATGTTIIDGGRIFTPNLSALSADLGDVNAGVIYNSGGSASNYNMKIDLNTGEIHIK